MVHRLRQRLPHQAEGRCSSRVGVMAISRIVGMPRPSSPMRSGIGPVELDFARGIGAVAELVLQGEESEWRCVCRRA